MSQDNVIYKQTKKIVLLAIFLGYALIIGVVERFIPFDYIVPGVKLGLANVVVLVAIYTFPFVDVLVLVSLKCILTAVFSGSFTSLLYSLSGSLLSFLVMYCITKLARDKVSAVGVSVIGAVCHNVGQIMAASLIMGTFLLFSYFPPLLISGIITGVLVGTAAGQVQKLVQRHFLRYSQSFMGQNHHIGSDSKN